MPYFIVSLHTQLSKQRAKGHQTENKASIQACPVKSFSRTRQHWPLLMLHIRPGQPR